MTSAEGPEIPLGLPDNVNDWSEDDVSKFLTENAKNYRLKETHINDIRKQEVAGIHLLKFTIQQFQSIGLGLGPADSIVTLAGTLKIAKGLVEPGKYYNSNSPSLAPTLVL